MKELDNRMVWIKSYENIYSIIFCFFVTTGSYSGALGKLERKLIDIYLKETNPFSLFENVAITPALSNEE